MSSFMSRAAARRLEFLTVFAGISGGRGGEESLKIPPTECKITVCPSRRFGSSPFRPRLAFRAAVFSDDEDHN